MYLIITSTKRIAGICTQARYVRRQSNGVVVLCESEQADAIYADDTNTFYPTARVGYLSESHSLVEVDAVPAGVVAGYYFYHAGEFYTTEDNLSALAAITDNDALFVDHEYRLTIIEVLTGNELSL